MGLKLRSDGRFYYQPKGWSSEMFIRKCDNGQILVYDYKNSFEMVFDERDIDAIIDTIKQISSRELTSDRVQDYRPRFKYYMRSNHIDRARAPHIIEMIQMFYNPLKELEEADDVNKVLNESSLYRLVVIHNAIERKRKEKAECLEQSSKELVS